MQIINHRLQGWDTQRLGRIAPAMERHLAQRHLPALAVSVGHRGHEVYCGAWRGPDVPEGAWRTDSIVRAYSMSKPITVAAAMMLYEEARLQIDDPISEYLPAFREMQVLTGGTSDAPETVPAETPITVRHLMMHTSGIVYPAAEGELIQRIYDRADARMWAETIATMADKVAALPLAHQPGSAWHYGLSIDVLGRLIEVVSGQTLDVFLRQRLFEPLGMTDTGFGVAPDKRNRLSPCYGPTGGEGLAPVETPFDSGEAPPFLCGGGGLLTTMDDYGRFCRMMLNGGVLGGQRVLSPQGIALMTMNHTSLDRIPVVPPTWPFREGYGMALGVRTLVDRAASQSLGTVGTYTWQGAASTDFWIDPARELYGLCLSQFLPGSYRTHRDFRVLVYQAMTA